MSQPLEDLIDLGFKMGIESVKNKGPFIPFVITENEKGERKTRRFINATFDESLQQAENYLSENAKDIPLAAIVFEATINIENQSADAILVKGLEKGKPEAWLYYLKYYQDTSTKNFQTFGEPQFLDHEANVLGNN